MESILVGVYLICFAVIAGGAFALMTQNLRRTPIPIVARSQGLRRPRHPEAPQPGEELLYVDLSRERLEALYEQAS
ncbi:MAG: hypothetical protein NTZ53_14200 [Cyanobacteria bacterium]|nr:hypothetical protein [Cyanobacteriota bacterium]